jgi:hypothetical protein
MRGMAERLASHEIENLIRSLAMAPLDSATIRQVLEDHRELLREQAELKKLLRRLTPAWGEVRTVLNELAAAVDP